MTDLIPNDLGHFEGNEVPQDFEYTDHADFDCEEHQFSHGGQCPCCGAQVYTAGGEFDDSEMQDICEICGWEGWPYYG